MGAHREPIVAPVAEGAAASHGRGARLAPVLGLCGLLVGAVAALLIGGGLFLSTSRFLVGGAGLGAACAAVLIARAFARSGRITEGAELASFALFGAAVALAVGIGPVYASSGVFAILGTLIAIPHAEPHRRARLFAGAIAAGTIAAAITVFGPPPPEGGARFGQGLGAGAFVAALLLLLLVLSDWRVRVDRELARAQGLWETERVFETVFDQGVSFIAILDATGVLRQINEASLVAGGISQDEVIGRPLWETPLYRHDPAVAEQLRQDVRDACAGRIVRRESSYGGAGGAIRHAERTVAPVRAPGGEVIRVVVEWRDITARREAEQAKAEVERSLAAHTAELQRSNQDLERFAYVASHDLQEPLRMISSFVQLLARRYKGKLDEDADRFIGHVVSGAERMQRLINDLLAYSRIGRKERAFAPVPLDRVVSRILKDLAPAQAESGATVSVLPPLPTVLGDEALLEQLFLNLVGNGIKFRAADPPRITISATQADGVCEVVVTDNGIGIDPKYFDRIFVIFQRLHGIGTYQGTGIGLAICKKIVERHGGRIWVESSPGAGATFRFTLSTAPEGSAAAALHGVVGVS